MILWTIKLINSVRKAIAGRRHPSQLAWGVALGCLLGLIPHGNLLAVALVLVVLTLRVNHAMAALTAVLVTLVAPKMDPVFHEVGTWFFGHESVTERMAWAWQLPFVPWTDLNNTVVMGSFLIGMVTLVPLFLLTYPVFRNWALALDGESEEEFADLNSPQTNSHRQVASPRSRESKPNDQIERTDMSHDKPTRPHVVPSPVTSAPAKATSGRVYDVRRVDSPEALAAPNLEEAPKTERVASGARQETKVAIEQQPAGQPPTSSKPGNQSPTNTNQAPANSVESDQGSADDQEKIDEALSYLLRQLRDSKEKDAA